MQDINSFALFPIFRPTCNSTVVSCNKRREIPVKRSEKNTESFINPNLIFREAKHGYDVREPAVMSSLTHAPQRRASLYAQTRRGQHTAVPTQPLANGAAQIGARAAIPEPCAVADMIITSIIPLSSPLLQSVSEEMEAVIGVVPCLSTINTSPLIVNSAAGKNRSLFV